jgi:hypothetical protein
MEINHLTLERLEIPELLTNIHGLLVPFFLDFGLTIVNN